MLSVQGLIDFAEFAQLNPSIMASEMDTGKRVSYKTLQDAINYASFKAQELTAESEEARDFAHQKAEEEYLKFPLRLFWRTPDIDKEYAHLRNLDQFTDGQLIEVQQRTIPELWETFFPYITVAKNTESYAIKKIKTMAKKMLQHRRGTHSDDCPDMIVDNIHMFLPPWAQWRQYFDGYSSVQNKNLPIGSLCHHGFRYEPHTEPFVK